MRSRRALTRADHKYCCCSLASMRSTKRFGTGLLGPRIPGRGHVMGDGRSDHSDQSLRAQRVRAVTAVTAVTAGPADHTGRTDTACAARSGHADSDAAEGGAAEGNSSVAGGAAQGDRNCGLFVSEQFRLGER